MISSSAAEQQPFTSLSLSNPRGIKRKKNNFKRKKELKFKKRIDPSSYLSDPYMTSISIPPFLQHSYLKSGITELRAWQKELFESDDWKNGKNGIILVPTSGGKTGAADLAIAQALIKERTAKAIFAFPFVALANEKYNEYVERFFPYLVRAFYMNIGGSDFRRGRIAICTYEKAHALLNAAINDGYENKIKLVVIDEFHFIGDESRGAVVEALIVKLMLMKSKPRILGITATLNKNDTIRLAKWIDGFSYIYEIRPTPIKQFVIKTDGVLSKLDSGNISPFVNLKNVPGDSNFIIDPIRTLLSRSANSTVIVFVNTRKETLKISNFIASKLYDNELNLPKLPIPSKELTQARSELLNNISKTIGMIDKYTSSCIMKGIGVHHAGMLLEERKLIEESARKKILSIIVATTTLSAGINIPSVSRIFILNIYRWTPNGNILIPVSQFTQMIGRAGRNGNHGDAFIVMHTNSKKEEEDLFALSKNQIGDVTTHLLDEGQFEKYFLQCLATNLIDPVDGLKRFAQMAFCKNKSLEIISKNLIDKKLIQGNEMIATNLGLAIASSGISIDEGLYLASVVNNIQKNLCLDDELHLLYLCTSPGFAETIPKEPYDSDTWISIFQQHLDVIQLITDQSRKQIAHLQNLPKIYGGLGRVNNEIDKKLDCVYTASIMLDLINEINLKDITKKYNVERGLIQSLQIQCATYAGQVSRFCEMYGAVLLSTTLNKFRQRLNFAARSELLSLMVLPSCKRDIARVLFNSGIKSPIELSELNYDAIYVIIKESTIVGISQEDIKQILKEAKEYTPSG